MIRKKKIHPRPLLITVLLEADDVFNFQKLKEDFAEWLVHDDSKSFVLDDEPDRIYYAVVAGSFDVEEFVRVGSGTILFVCSIHTNTVQSKPSHYQVVARFSTEVLWKQAQS